jgi:hypothetical protein
VASRTVVAAPRLTPPTHSLVRSAITNVDAEPDWEKGLIYAPETPGSYRALSHCTAQTVDHTRDRVENVDYQPWELQVEDPCLTTFGYNRQERSERLQRAMAATESYAIARELMRGELAQADAAAGGTGEAANNYLAKAPTVLSATPLSHRRGIGELEEAAAELLKGQQTFLHVSPSALPQFAWLTKTGPMLYPYRDSVIVSDAGYSRHAPDGEVAADGVAWLYATGPVVVRRSMIFEDPPDAQIIDTATNTVIRRISRVVAATFDPTAHLAVPITLD